jgi:ssDNA-binding replication factor A large subunit
MNAPSTLREALAGQILSEVDDLIRQAESLKATLQAASQDLSRNVTTLDDAGDRFRMAVTSFTEQAKVELTEHMERTAHIVLTQKADEIHATMQKAARTAFEAQSWDTAGALADRLKSAADEFRRGVWTRLVENGVVALLAGVLASALTYGLTSR